MVAPVIRPARVLDQDLNSNWQEEVLSYHLVWNINPNSSKYRRAEPETTERILNRAVC